MIEDKTLSVDISSTFPFGKEIAEIEAKPLTEMNLEALIGANWQRGVPLSHLGWVVSHYEPLPQLWSDVLARCPPEMLATMKASENLYRSRQIQRDKRLNHALRVRRRKLKGGHKK